MFVWCILFAFFQISPAHWAGNNVCRTFPDYATIGFNKNCWFNPDAFSSPSQIAKRYGYPLKKYKVTTEDGYILTLYRIPHNNTDLNLKRQPVLLQHGLAARAIYWMLIGQKSLAFFLANNGYDVWMSNARGVAYSTQHKYLTTRDPSYWNFGFHEMGMYDLPAVIEFISNVTNQKGNIIYIGHSMGTTISYIYSSARKDHAVAHLKGLISLSPVAYLQNIDPALKALLPVFRNLVKSFINAGIYSIGPLGSLHRVIYKFCGFYPTIIHCFLLSTVFTGVSYEQVSPEHIPVFASYYPETISLKTLQHFLQLIDSDRKFQQYDYTSENLVHYRSSTPPTYDITNISLPIFLFIGRQDSLATEKDADVLYHGLSRPVGKTQVSRYFFNFAHNDFLLGRDPSGFHKILLDVMMNKIGNT